MFVLYKNDEIQASSFDLGLLISMIGFTSKTQYYNFIKNKPKKFKHLECFKIVNINQQTYFSPFNKN